MTDSSRFKQMSPFTFKDLLVQTARESLGEQAAILDASRGSANWQNREVQTAWHVLGLYCDYTYGVAGDEAAVRLLPQKNLVDHSVAFQRFTENLIGTREVLSAGIEYLLFVWQYLSLEVFPDWDESDIIAAFTSAMSGGPYPTPANLDFVQPICAAYFSDLLFGGDIELARRFQVHLAPGATAAFGQVARTLAANGLLNPGDKVAMLLPAYEPMRDFFTRQLGCRFVGLERSRETGWMLTETEAEKLADPAVRLFVEVSPGNPLPFCTPSGDLDVLSAVIARRPDLLILGDYVYANFIPGPLDSLLHRLPLQTIGVYSPSKDFGLAGARLGAALLHEDCMVNDLLTKRPHTQRDEADALYASREWDAPGASFFTRLVRQSHQISFSHMAGLAGPSQVLFCLAACYPGALKQQAPKYFNWVRTQLQRRYRALYRGLGITPPDCPAAASSHYCAFVNLQDVAENLGDEAKKALQNHTIWDFMFHIARSRGTIIMPGIPFGGEHWSVRICLPALGENEYLQVGKNIAIALQNLPPGEHIS